MAMIQGRVSRWVEFRFWQMVVRALSLLRPVQRHLAQRRATRTFAARPQSYAFIPTLITALAGWGLGLALGFFLMRVWF